LVYVAETLLKLRKDTAQNPIVGLDGLLMDTLDAGDRVKPPTGIPEDGPRQMEDFAFLVFSCFPHPVRRTKQCA
jgi:hypothetical protein